MYVHQVVHDGVGMPAIEEDGTGKNFCPCTLRRNFIIIITRNNHKLHRHFISHRSGAQTDRCIGRLA